MSNLPVLWVPPVTPPEPDERPPRRRAGKGVLMAAVVILAMPVLAVAVFGESTPRPAATVAATVEKTEVPVSPKSAAAVKVASQDTPTPVPPPASTSIGPAPDTSGGNQPYMAAPIPTKTAPEASNAEAPRAVGPDGRPVRVIDLDRKAEDREPVAVPPTRTQVTAPVPVPAAAAKVEATPATPAPAAPPIEAAAPRGTISEPVQSKAEPATPPVTPTPAAPIVVRAEPAPVRPDPILRVDPPPQPSESKATVIAPVEPKPTEPESVVVVPKSPEPKAVVVAPKEPKPVEAARSVPPKAGEAKSAEPKVTVVRPSEPGAVKVPLPPKRETAVRRPPTAEDRDFADRLAAIRRAESRRAVEAPPPPAYDDEEEIVVVPAQPRRWGILPPFFEGPARGPVLRSYEEPPPREVMRRAPQAENCHYHAWPTEEMAFHRTVRCHWHRDPEDPSIRYVR